MSGDQSPKDGDKGEYDGCETGLMALVQRIDSQRARGEEEEAQDRHREIIIRHRR